MTLKELEVLLALCRAAPALNDLTHAQRLSVQLCDYLPESHVQHFASSPFLHDIHPSPWEALTYQLTNALLSIGVRFPTLKAHIAGTVQKYLASCAEALSTTSLSQSDGMQEQESLEGDATAVASISVSFIGFMDAAAKLAHFWNSHERKAIIKQFQGMLSEKYLIDIETASSTLRNASPLSRGSREWRRYLRRYAARSNPLGAMLLQQGFMRFVLACTSRLLASEESVESGDLLDQYMAGAHLERASEQVVSEEMLQYLTDVIGDQIHVLDEGSDYLQLGSAWQQHLAFSVKAYCLEAFLHCLIIDEDIADADLLFDWLEDSLNDPIQMADESLADIVLKSLAVVAKYIPESTANFARILLRFIVQGSSRGPVVSIAAECLAHILRILSSDAVITTLYSLGNVLSSNAGAEKIHPNSSSPEGTLNTHSQIGMNLRTGSVISIEMSGDEETTVVCGNVAHAIVVIAQKSKEGRITALAQAMMLQKVGRINLVVDARILEEAAMLATTGKESEFRALLRFYSRLHEDAVQQNNTVISQAVLRARNYLAREIDNNSPLFRIYLVHLLERVIAKGDIIDGDSRHPAEVQKAALEIAPLLKPLAILVARQPTEGTDGALSEDEEVALMSREAWFNVAVHGINLHSRLGQEFYQELRTLAMHSKPLVDPTRAELLESDVELNTILRRGLSSQHTSDQRKTLTNVLPTRESAIRSLPYQKVVFLNAVFLVESLRANAGNCAEILHYFLDPSMKNSDMGRCMSTIAERVVKMYIDKALPATEENFTAPFVSKQLAQILSGCCHRIATVQQTSNAAANEIIQTIPSALCQKSALFALLELLSIMWSSCLDAEIDEYEWKSEIASNRGKVKVELSDNYSHRRTTLNDFYKRCRTWVTTVMGIAPLDVKGLLQTYLSEYDDTGSYGHVALGRSFALEMGSLIPPFDQRLGAIDRRGGEGSNVNVASDFIAQYTTRQEYRYAEVPDHDSDWLKFMHLKARDKPLSPTLLEGGGVVEEARSVLHDLEQRSHLGGPISEGEVRDVLRRGASLLCRSKKSQSAIVYHLVNIPFVVFSKASIKLGISLWLGVIHENPRMESRILTEVALAWERTIDREIGIFSKHFNHPDPFYVKEEFAPVDRAVVARQQQHIQNLISPHFRILQFFESHFNAIRLGSANTQRTFLRMMCKTLKGFRKMTTHPLAREIHFHTILFGTHVLRFNTCFAATAQWRLKDLILSAGLSWFKQPPAWSFGGNKLQMKAEVKIMADILVALNVTRNYGSATTASRRSLLPKQELYESLVQNEMDRLTVWLYTLEHTSGHDASNEARLSQLTEVAWKEDPGLAVQLVKRFPHAGVRQAVRSLLLKDPSRAISVADSLEILLGESLPSDVQSQLKCLLYWAPVNPMQAVTYFLPAFSNHPFILQYAIRALESHSIDVTFFYVPQIVQSLRYDSLGYVESYIIETGKFSQLFAHQIIWNMKANAYKDEDSTEPDSLKPTLDRVMNSLVTSFSGEDKDFYEREFAFFGEVTDISGKLKPFIKKSKPEKKQKIEEELRKIKVEVGVYLPSNPDGVVIGIDRKSGKPLQSHAKAPYMATFRIRKKRIDAGPNNAAAIAKDAPKDQKRPTTARSTSISSAGAVYGELADDSKYYEVWQSAIFKVGDDCRQDVLALQMIAAFRGIYNSCGLDVYVYPYRVTATAPGCGVIDVLPNSISRDMLGREAVNGLYDYFVTKYGGEDSVRYQEARLNFVKSMAAYSVISYLLQFKDRHNGNIMVDDKGHILHIDFGFCFDIAPGGVKFERAPFKLTPEMLAVMGGPSGGSSQTYRWFEELTIKAFLASRPYCEKLCHLVMLMLDSGLPCFKPETVKHFKDRFVLDKSERQAAEFMRGCIRKSEANFSTKVYDEFQLLTNGIPY